MLHEFQAKYTISNGLAAELCSCSVATIQKWRNGSVFMPSSTQKLLILVDMIYAGNRSGLVEFIEKTRNMGTPDADGQLRKLNQSADHALEVIRSQEYRKVRQESEYYRLMIETQEDAVCRWRPDTTLTYVNKALCEKFKGPTHDLIDAQWLSFVPEEERSAVQEQIVSARVSGKPFRHAFSLINAQGERFDTNWTIVPVLGDEGGVVEFHSVGRDITAERLASTMQEALLGKVEAIYAAIPDMLMVMRPDGTIEDVNPSLERELGCTRADVIGLPLMSLCPDNAKAGALSILREAEKGGYGNFTLSVQRRNGEVIDAEIATSPVSWGGADLIVGIMRNVGIVKADCEIVARKLQYDRVLRNLSAKSLRATPGDLDEILDHTLLKIGQTAGVDQVFLFQLDKDRRCVSITHEWCSAGQASIASRYQEVLVSEFLWWMEELRNRRTIVIHDVLEMPPEAEAEQRVLQAQGIRALLAAPIAEQGSLAGFVVLGNLRSPRSWHRNDRQMLRTASDLIWLTMVRCQQDVRLQASHSEFEQALRGADLGFWWWRIPSGEVQFNGQYCSMLGYGSDELESSPETWRRLIHPDDYYSVLERLTQYVRGTSSAEAYESEFRMRHKDGGWIWVLSRGRIVERDAFDNAERLVGTHLNITKLKEAELQMRQAKRLAESVTLAKAEFLSNVSHELRTPMNSIIGMAQMLQLELQDPELSEMADTILKSSDDMMKLIVHLLDTAQLVCGKAKASCREMDLRQVIDGLMGSSCREAKSKHLRLTCIHASGLPDRILSDEGCIRQVLTSLIENAIKFTLSGFVSIRTFYRPTSAESGILTLCVRDSGIGIPEDKQADVFGPFVQADGSSTRRFRGCGLGLVKVQKLVRMMGGELQVRSQVQKGTLFAVRLPVSVPPAHHPKGEGLPRVLIVEDDRLNQLVLDKMLRRLGCLTTISSNGVEAVDAAERGSYDMIFMDIEMPVMSGLDATQSIRRREHERKMPRSVICAVTAYAMPGDREKYLAAGMDAYVPKPIKINAIRNVLQEHVKGLASGV
ncbi:PAS domain S-box protein [Pontiella sulfatireligans]|uniref:histidine kinase n=1 Tax=Pontiella sulfatireligans TaxID=2750658 RepID=A0A6C2UUD0_9BACT|nr:PAS domain S-box protein [Pontiella sulfatireligans]VGO22496.1 Autoinducer 2 sensor kinase/phosphatase LuxQ [Pontiella sulfatireligans]